MKKCPFCAEEIQDTAVLCKHCGRELTAAPSKPTVTTPPTDLNRKLGGKELFGYLAIGIGALMTIASGTTAGFGFLAMWIGLGLTLGGGAVTRWGGGFIAALIMMAIGMSMGGNRYGGASTAAAPRTGTTATSAPAPATPQLELLSSRGYDEHGYHQVEGEVKNISDQSLENVAVVVNWYTDGKQLVKSDDTLIKFNPILPGQTSAFKSMTTSNPAMSNYTVSFKRLFGGTLRTKDSRPN